jgi:hypothetical protein
VESRSTGTAPGNPGPFRAAVTCQRGACAFQSLR